MSKVKNFLWPQWSAAAEVAVLSLMVGMNNGWTSPFLSDLMDENTPFEVTKDQIGWIASLVNLCRIFGVIIGSVFMYMKGSKFPIYICGYYFLISWVCLIFANTIEIVYISLVLNGISQGTVVTIFPMYIGEIADPKIRGSLVSLTVQGLMTGMLLGTIMGTYLAPWIYAAINLVPCLIFIVTFWVFPHTAHYLVNNGKMEEATHSIQWYNRNADASTDLKILSEFLTANPKLTFVETIRKLNTPVNRKALIIMITIYGFSYLTGLSTLQVYAEILFTEAQVTIISPASLVIVMGVINIITCWASVYVISKFGRTTILSVTSIMLSMGLFGWGLHYHLLDLGFDEPNLQWITIIFSMLYRINVTIGMLPIVPTILSEIFAPDVKYMAVCICNIMNALCAFISTKYFQFMVDSMTYKYVFYLFAGVTMLLAVYSKIVIPETKGKSLPEIQAMMNKYKQEKVLDSND